MTFLDPLDMRALANGRDWMTLHEVWRVLD
jgi:hypothetical protein